MMPTLLFPVSQLVSESQCRENIYRLWSYRLGLNPDKIIRKQWEYIYIIRSLFIAAELAPGKKGLGFGVGLEPLPALFAGKGAKITATDGPGGILWENTEQYAQTKDDLYVPDLCSPELWETVEYSRIDMNNIHPDWRMGDFDFCWSCSSMDHLGSISRATEFIFNSLECLKPGGVSVHTTEYNISSDVGTLDNGDVIFFRNRDILAIVERLKRDGHRINLNLTRGNYHYDRFAPSDPYPQELLCLTLGGYVTTSIGLTIRKKR